MHAFTRYIVLDTETTGVTNEDRIIDLYAVVIDLTTGKTGASFSLRCNPHRVSHPRAFEKHQISEADVQASPSFDAYAQALLTFLSGHCIIAHNAKFDARMLRLEFDRIDPALLAQAPFAFSCSMLAAKEILRRKEWPSLDFLCDHFNVDRSARFEKHAARLDVELLAQVLPKLQERYSTLLNDASEDTRNAMMGEHSHAIFGNSIPQRIA